MPKTKLENVVFTLVMAFVMVMPMFHAFHDFLHFDVIAQTVEQIDDDHVGVDGLPQRVLHPLVRFAAHTDEHVTGGNPHDVCR